MAAFASRQDEGNRQNVPIIYAQDFLHVPQAKRFFWPCILINPLLSVVTMCLCARWFDFCLIVLFFSCIFY